MLEAPEVEAHRHHTGHSRIDLIFGCLAVVLSGVSVFIAIHHGETMERLVAANTWPNLTFDNSNEVNGQDMIALSLKNTGVGPARIETFELFYKDKPMGSLHDLGVATGVAGHYKGSYNTGPVQGEVLPAREEITFLGLRRDKNPPELWDVFNKERFNLRVRACYCSVFDECWVADTATKRPARVAECAPSQAVEAQF